MKPGASEPQMGDHALLHPDITLTESCLLCTFLQKPSCQAGQGQEGPFPVGMALGPCVFYT